MKRIMTSSEEQENSNKRIKQTEESIELNIERVSKEIECVNKEIKLVQNYVLSLAADDITRDIYIGNLTDLRKDKDSLQKDKDSLREERLILLRQSGMNNTHLGAVVYSFP
jgi:SMC interacting uncharacterized protein involved in chromosome segregation